MKLATIKNGKPDGQLVVVDEKGQLIAPPAEYVTMQSALDDWNGFQSRVMDQKEPSIYSSHYEYMAPIPRAYQWVDGSGYIYHVELVRKARGASLPEHIFKEPIMYQGASDKMMAPSEPLVGISEDSGIDFEAELAVITDEVPMGVSAEEALKYIRLITLICDWSLRDLIPGELAKGFGFFVSKPATSFAPYARSVLDLKGWDNGVLHSNIVIDVNGKRFGSLYSDQDLTFNFGHLISHTARTRNLAAGTIVGGGTVANRAKGTGHACIAEKRAVEMIENGKPITEYLKVGDTLKIEAFNDEGESIFGAIQTKIG